MLIALLTSKTLPKYDLKLGRISGLPTLVLKSCRNKKALLTIARLFYYLFSSQPKKAVAFSFPTNSFSSVGTVSLRSSLREK